MAKTIQRIIESVKEELAQYKLSDNFPITDEYLLDKANDVRASMIRDEYRNGRINERYYSSACCIEITCLKQGCTINGEFIEEGTTLWVAELPKLINGIGWGDIRYLGKMNFAHNFQRMNFEGWMNMAGNLVTGTKPSYTIVESTAYFKNLPTSGMSRLCLLGLLYNPVEICDYTEDKEYPVPSDSTLQLLMKKDILSTYPGLPDPMPDNRYPDIFSTGIGARRQQESNKTKEE